MSVSIFGMFTFFFTFPTPSLKNQILPLNDALFEMTDLTWDLIFQWKQGENTNSAAPIVWLAVSEDNISLLELGSMQPIASYSYSHVLTFGGCQEDFMLVINSEDGLRSHKLLFSMSKPKVICFVFFIHLVLFVVIASILILSLHTDFRTDSDNS